MLRYAQMTLSELQTDVRWKTRTTTAEYADTDLNRAINAGYHFFAMKILEAQDAWDFQGQIATANVVASQQEYTFPTDILKVKRADITFDGTEWHRVQIFNVSEDPAALDTQHIADNYNKQRPYMALMRNSLFIYPAPDANVTAGLRLWYSQEVTALSVSGDEPTIEEAFHVGLSEWAAKAYFDRKGFVNDSQLAQANIDRIVQEMEEFYGSRIQDEYKAIGSSSALGDYR